MFSGKVKVLACTSETSKAGKQYFLSVCEIGKMLRKVVSNVDLEDSIGSSVSVNVEFTEFNGKLDMRIVELVS
jgi:hypothetical protein